MVTQVMTSLHLPKKLLIKRNFSILHSEFLKAEFLKTASRN